MNKKLSIKESNNMSFASLPEDCIAHIISLTDACVASVVSLGFKSAAESDTVWERYLPSDYKDIIGRSSSSQHRSDPFSSLKELYFKLCDTPLLLDEGKLSFRLMKPNGKKRYMMSVRELSIAWQNDPMYWKWKSLPESRFAEVVQLVNVCWLAMSANLQASILSPEANYSAYLVFKLAEEHYGLDESSKSSVYYVDHYGVAESETTVPNTVHIVRQTRNLTLPLTRQLPRARTDSWDEIELGDEKRDVRVNLYETECLSWKSGLIVDGIELRPRI